MKHPSPAYLTGTPLSRQWLAALFVEAVAAADRDCRRNPGGLGSHDEIGRDASQYVIAYLLAHTGLADDEQTALVARILGQHCRI
jgi:hypothetical protein